MGSETEAFLADMLPKQRAAERAIHDGNVEPRLALWSRNDPVSLYGAKLSASGWAHLEPIFHTVASWFSGAVDYEFEVVAAGASGDLAYTVGYEHTTASREGKPRTYTVRVTQLYCREPTTWKVFHRHADELA